MKKYALEYIFHVITVNLEDKEQKKKIEYYDYFEDLLKDYREKKEKRAYNVIPYMTDFKWYIANLEEQNLDSLNSLL